MLVPEIASAPLARLLEARRVRIKTFQGALLGNFGNEGSGICASCNSWNPSMDARLNWQILVTTLIIHFTDVPSLREIEKEKNVQRALSLILMTKCGRSECQSFALSWHSIRSRLAEFD